MLARFSLQEYRDQPVSKPDTKRAHFIRFWMSFCEEQFEADSEPRESGSICEECTGPTRQRVYKKYRVRACLDLCKYAVVHDVCRRFRWKECDELDSWNLLWYDWAIEDAVYSRMLPYQKINHFPGMEQITRKDTLARNLNRCRRQFPDAYDFYPQTFYLPNDEAELRKQFQPGKIYLAKPVASCQGRGIYLFNSLSQCNTKEPQVVQEYLANPWLIDGYKFDLRLYVVVLQVLPFPVILWFDEGLARLCTIPYERPTVGNLDQVCMHLTNYALNKQNDNFVFNEDAEHGDQGSKRSLESVFKRLQEEGCDTDVLKEDIKALFIKTIFSILPQLQHGYLSARPGVPKYLGVENPFDITDEFFGSNCFEILGFDVMIDSDYKPWLIEVNHSPSFTCDTPLDLDVKETLISTVLEMLDICQDDKIIHQRTVLEQRQKRLYGTQKPRDAGTRAKDTALKLPSTAQKQLPTYKSVHEHIAQVIESSGRFEQIYPLPTGTPDVYREMVLQLKNPFMTPEQIQKLNSVVPRNLDAAVTIKKKAPLPPKLGGKPTQKVLSKPKQTTQLIARNQPGSARAYQVKEPSLRPRSAAGLPEPEAQPKKMSQGYEDALKLLLAKMSRDAEFGIQIRNEKKLAAGIPRNAKTDEEIQRELDTRKRALQKFRLHEQVNQLVELIQHDM